MGTFARNFGRRAGGQHRGHAIAAFARSYRRRMRCSDDDDIENLQRALIVAYMRCAPYDFDVLLPPVFPAASSGRHHALILLAGRIANYASAKISSAGMRLCNNSTQPNVLVTEEKANDRLSSCPGCRG